ncbi:MAG: AEC family transporter, partial [Veillonella sp.]|nr:AEC family transporter [Veillonella sp.]
PKFDWKKLLPPPLIGFFVALIFLFFEIPLLPILHTTLNYLGDMVTPLSLIYIGIVLHDAGLKSMRLNKDSIGGIVGRFVISPIIMFCLITALQYGAGIVLEPIALPIVANESKADLPFATGLVMISTILFVVVIPIIMEILTMIGIQA